MDKRERGSRQAGHNPQGVKDLLGARILLVDDNRINVAIAKMFLVKWNTFVDTCDKGVAAVAMARQHKYDLILMDLQMPEMDGLMATAKIRLFHPHVPIIALTASDGSDVQEQVRHSSMTDLIIKPFDADELYRKLEGYLFAAPDGA